MCASCVAAVYAMHASDLDASIPKFPTYIRMQHLKNGDTFIM